MAELTEEVGELNEVIERLTHEVAELQLDKQEWDKGGNLVQENEELRAQIEELERSLGKLARKRVGFLCVCISLIFV